MADLHGQADFYAPSERVHVYRDGDCWVIGDEGGEFARASTIEGALPYVRDLLYGPSTRGPGS